MHLIKKWLSLASFLLIAYPATSQSVTIVKGDTLVCFPDHMVRQIIADLEAGDQCAIERISLEKSIEDYKKLVETNKAQLDNLQQRLVAYDDIFIEKQSQIDLRDKEISVLEKEKKAKFWSGLSLGGVSGASIVAILLLL